MKKTICILFALILTLTLAACGGDGGGIRYTTTPSDNSGGGTYNDTPSAQAPAGNEPSETAPSQSSGDGGIPEGAVMASLIKWMKDGTYSFDYTMTAEGLGETMSGSGSMAADGDKTAMSQEMTVDGQRIRSRTIRHGDKMYVIDDENKTIMEMSGMDAMEGMIEDYSGMALTGTGTGEINGKTLPYEEYTLDALGATTKYFLDGGEVYGMVTEVDGMKTTMILSNVKDKPSAGAFDLPSGYTDPFDLSGFGLDGFDISQYLPDGFTMP
ncbi:MAG: hypothetical protein LBH95_05945 [Oscillospiraceae bacterium]|nr:hypothetical protein [Oscillospiraceae bacterium]